MNKPFLTEPYATAKQEWPSTGKHILAQFDDDSVLVYQAYRKEIADYAVQNGKFGGCAMFDAQRMTWIKTNMLWMMFRCDWARKDCKQERVLAIRLKRVAFDRYLEQATTNGKGREVTVRLQWDPDHLPNGRVHTGGRRAIQLGLKGVTGFIEGDDILQIQDITPFAQEQREKLNDDQQLAVAQERVYVPGTIAACEAVGIDSMVEQW
jgi:Domain of unknown function (DUF4291)